MKKSFFIILIMIFTSSLFAQNNAEISSIYADEELEPVKKIPEQLYGLWEGKDRYIFIEENSDPNKSPEIVVVLKLFYGWYYDRAAESKEISDAYAKARNDGTGKEAQHITMEINDINGSLQENNAWEITLNYSKYDKAIIPVAVHNDKMYLNFFVKNLIYDEDGNPIITSNGVWRGNIVTEGLKISKWKEIENIPAYIVQDNKYYDVRYWKTDMEFSNENAIFEYGNESYYVPKHIISGENIYTCVTGRRLRVRNPQPSFVFNEEDYYFNEDKTLMIPKQEEYLVKVADKKTIEDLIQIVNSQNSKRKPPQPPYFEDKNLDWHWDVIIELQKYNPYVQAVRQRQKDRGIEHTN